MPSRRKPDQQTADLPSLVRLLTLHVVAGRLSLSYWGARDLVVRGYLPAIVLPGKRGKNLRRILIDERDLEKFISEHREVRPVAGAAVRPIKRLAVV